MAHVYTRKTHYARNTFFLKGKKNKTALQNACVQIYSHIYRLYLFETAIFTLTVSCERVLLETSKLSYAYIIYTGNATSDAQNLGLH